jgi:predicted Zn finger-like uncharacterized protein
MLIVCPNCATSYRVESGSLGAAGRSVRCVRCRSVWFAHDPAALSAVAETYRNDVMVVAETAAENPELAASALPAPAADGIEIAEVPQADQAAIDASPDEHEAAIGSTLPEQELLPEDREPIAIVARPAHATIEHAIAEPLADAMIGEDIETVAARHAKRTARRRFHLPGLPATIMALIAINTILIGWRADVVKVLPQTASLYAAVGLPVNLRGLAFADVTTVTEMHEGVPVLVVEGTIASASRRVVEVPRLRFAVRNPKGQEIYSWTALPTRSVLAPGETLAFRSRLASPPPEGNDVTVRFFNRHDRVAGIP